VFEGLWRIITKGFWRKSSKKIKIGGWMNEHISISKS
jgi:hypothetical protein